MSAYGLFDPSTLPFGLSFSLSEYMLVYHKLPFIGGDDLSFQHRGNVRMFADQRFMTGLLSKHRVVCKTTDVPIYCLHKSWLR